MKKYKSGFSLAEVLITLVTIGIIATMAIPSLMNKINEQDTVVAVKKANSVLSQAYQRVIAENGEIFPQYLGSSQDEATKNLGDIFAKQLSIQKNCEMSSDGDCWATDNDGMYKFYNGNDWINWNSNSSQYKIRLNNGTSLSLLAYKDYTARGEDESLQYVFGAFFVDINGGKSPNTLGKDVFAFWITKYGVLPYGTAQVEDVYSLSTCRTTGRGCTAWVVIKGNLDYIREDVSW